MGSRYGFDHIELAEPSILCFINVNRNSNKGNKDENANYRRSDNTADVANVHVFSERLQHMGRLRQGR